MTNGVVKTLKPNAVIPIVADRLAPLHQPSAPLRNKIIAALRAAIETGALARTIGAMYMRAILSMTRSCQPIG